MKSIMRILKSAYEGLITIMLGAGAVLIFFLMMLISSDIVGRAFLNHPIAGTPEIVKISLVTILFLGITKTLSMGRHVQGTVLANRLSSSQGCALGIMINFFGFVLFALLCYSSWDLTWSAWRILEYEGEGSLRVPTYPLRLLILLSSILMAFQFTINIVENVKKMGQSRKK